MAVEIKTTENEMTAVLTGEIDHHNAKRLREEIDHAISKSKPMTLVMDFCGVGFMDSSGIGLVMGRYRLITVYGGQIIVRLSNPTFHRIMKMAGLEKLAKIQEVKR